MLSPGFVTNECLLEYGKISPEQQTANDTGLKVFFEKDEKKKPIHVQKQTVTW